MDEEQPFNVLRSEKASKPRPPRRFHALGAAVFELQTPGYEKSRRSFLASGNTEPKGPLVSAIITTYNRAELAGRAISSVLAQTHDNIECIVIDDCSTDDTAKKLAALAATDPRVSVIRHQVNCHLSAARNTGIEASKGQYIAFLDDDDVWLPGKIEAQLKVFQTADANVGLVYCWSDIYKGDVVIGHRHPDLRGMIFDDMLLSQPLGNGSTLLIKRDIPERLGGFDTDLRRGIDGDFLRRVALHYKIERVPQVLVHYFVDHDGHPRITSLDREGILKEIRSHQAKLAKFPDALAKRPRLHASLLSLIGRRYARLGMGRDAWISTLEAVKIRPLQTSIYISSAKAVYDYLFRRLK